jgi:hypothetical protein
MQIAYRFKDINVYFDYGLPSVSNPEINPADSENFKLSES